MSHPNETQIDGLCINPTHETDARNASAKSAVEKTPSSLNYNEDYLRRFDEVYYLQTYPDIISAGVKPIEHYNINGWRENRNPSLSFDASAYLAWNSDVRRANINPLLHYAIYGIEERRLTFAVGDKLSEIISYSLNTEGEISIDVLRSVAADIYGNCRDDWQRGCIASKLCDWQVALRSFMRHLQASLHDKHGWHRLAVCLQELRMPSEALYAATAAVAFGFDASVIDLAFRTSIVEKGAHADGMPLWADKYTDV